jgi:hypothetical protein
MGRSCVGGHGELRQLMIRQFYEGARIGCFHAALLGQLEACCVNHPAGAQMHAAVARVGWQQIAAHYDAVFDALGAERHKTAAARMHGTDGACT